MKNQYTAIQNKQEDEKKTQYEVNLAELIKPKTFQNKTQNAKRSVSKIGTLLVLFFVLEMVFEGFLEDKE